MTRVKSLAHGIKQIANPYESFKPTAKSTYHRTHRTKKTKGGYKRRMERIMYKKKLLKLKLKELSTPIDIPNMVS